MKNILSVRNLIILLLVIAVGAYFFKNSKTAKVEIQNTAEKDQEAEVKNVEPVVDATSADQNSPAPVEEVDSQANSSSSDSVTKVNAQPAGGSASEIQKESSRLSLKGGPMKIVNKLMSSGFQKATGRKIDTVIVHSSYCAVGADPFDVGCVIGEYKDYGVSAHYLIGRDGTVYRLVDEKNIAWHAGVAKVPDGRTDVNSFSIGIEIINTKSDKFSSDQYSALNKLLAQIKSEYSIKYILGHDQVAPGRKDDPWNIDWDKVKK